MSSTFNVKDLTPYVEDNEELDLRPNSIQPMENDVHCGDNKTEQE